MSQSRLSLSHNDKPNNKLRLIFKIVIFTIINTVLVLIILSAIIGYRTLNPPRLNLSSTPQDYGLYYESVSFKNNRDNIDLSGWWIPSNKSTDKVIIFSHGYGYNRQKMPIDTLKLAKTLNEEGYNILMFDFRNSGKSDKSETTIGRKEKYDLLSAIDYIEKRHNAKDIGLIGWSMGASTSIIVASESKQVKAVIADSPFASLDSYIKQSFHYWTKFPKELSSAVSTLNEGMYPEFKPSDVKPSLAAKKLNDTSLLLIHSKEDQAIPYSQSKLIYKNAKNAEIWLTEEGGHIRSYNYNKEKYEQKVIKFFNENL